MTDDRTGEPAYPVPMDNWDHGMTLRDYFAGQAIGEVIAHFATIRAADGGIGLQVTDHVGINFPSVFVRHTDFHRLASQQQFSHPCRAGAFPRGVTGRHLRGMGG